MKKHACTTKHKVLTGIAVVGLATALTVPFVAYGADAPALGWGVTGSRACGTCAGADGNGACNSFADANGDGVCDNRGVHAACSAFSRGFAAFGECGRALGANFVDEDGDGIIIDPVKGEGYSGYMMVVLDPSRVIMGSIPASYGIRGYTVEEMVQEFDAVAGINAGGFYDPEGQGNGSIPDSLVVVDGELYYASAGCRNGFVGFDSQHIMHVGMPTNAEIKEKGIQTGACFGPVLVANGEAADLSTLGSGVNPRTAIGQRSDGAVLMLVIDGRQATSMGAKYQDLVDIMLEYGAVNACNLDGGSSSLMWYEGSYVNNSASVIGIRPVPTSFLVLKEGASANG